VARLTLSSAGYGHGAQRRLDSPELATAYRLPVIDYVVVLTEPPGDGPQPAFRETVKGGAELSGALRALKEEAIPAW
jgi:hypothetical protein